MSKMLKDNYSHDSITRMLAQDELDQSLFWKIIKPTICQIDRAARAVNTDTFLPAEQVTDVYKKRWGSEELHRSLNRFADAAKHCFGKDAC